LRTFDLLGAKDSFAHAIEVDPNFSLAHSYLAEAWEALGYDELAKQQSHTAFDLSTHLRREDKIVIEARFRALNGEWESAINLYRSLYTLYPENLEYAYRATDAQIRGGHADGALQLIAELRKPPSPVATDPRLDLKAAEAEEALSDFAKEKQFATRAAEGARAKGYRLLEAEALWRSCAAMASLGDLAGAESACRSSVEQAQPVGDLLLVARGFTILGRVAEARGDSTQRLQQHRQALQFASKIGSRRDMVGALINIANATADLGDLVKAQRAYQDALAVAREINDRAQIVALLNDMATVTQSRGDYPGALRLYQQALNEALAVSDKDSAARAQNNLGAIYFLQGDFVRAEENLKRAVQTATETGHKNDEAQFLYILGETKLAMGDLVAAESHCQDGLKLANEVGDKSTIASGQMCIADLRLQSGKALEVEALVGPAADEFRKQGMRDEEAMARNLLSSALLDLGRTEEAQKELETIKAAPPQDAAVQLSVAVNEARFQALAGRASLAAAFGSLNQKSQKLGLLGLQFEVRLAQGEAALNAGERNRGVNTLSALEKDADRRGFRQIARRAKNLKERYLS
jgi:tetratricopeptide (TPR) repeat protein